MKHKLKELFSKGKPDFLSSNVWVEYVENGDQKAFYRMNLEKTVITSTLITISLANIMSGLIDIFKNPHPVTLIDCYQMMGGVVIFVLAVLVVFAIDRAEELRLLRKKEEEEETRRLIEEMINKRQ